jgi:Domain of unknown function (DUF6458)
MTVFSRVHMPSLGVFADELVQAPRRWTEKAYPNLVHFNEVDRGGQFAAWEQPELYASDRLGRCAPFAADGPGQESHMTIGTSIFLIALGAILAFAVDATLAGFSIQTAGVILMVAGAVGLVIGLFLLSSRRARPAGRTVYDDRSGRTVYDDRPL